jgi:hypothetical protein
VLVVVGGMNLYLFAGTQMKAAAALHQLQAKQPQQAFCISLMIWNHTYDG